VPEPNQAASRLRNPANWLPTGAYLKGIDLRPYQPLEILLKHVMMVVETETSKQERRIMISTVGLKK
jgi:hypothetical protein